MDKVRIRQDLKQIHEQMELLKSTLGTIDAEITVGVGLKILGVFDWLGWPI